ncbi:hypothetical protein ACM66B_001533 [Microbotryomycetes sp. NB124-2]
MAFYDDQIAYNLDGDGFVDAYSSGGSSDLFYTAPEYSTADMGLYDDEMMLSSSIPGASVDYYALGGDGTMYSSPLDYSSSSYFAEPAYTYSRHHHGHPILHRDDLYSCMDWLDREMPLYEAWGDYSSWTAGNYALADLMHYQRQLELDTALHDSERMRRWEERLRLEALNDVERRLRYQTMEPMLRSRLGLTTGYWSSQYGGWLHGQDLGYLRNLTLRRGLFSTPFRRSWLQYPTLQQRFMPYLSRSTRSPPRQYNRPRRASTTGYVAAQSVLPNQQMNFHSQPQFRSRSLSNDSAYGMREHELQLLLRNAELRASLTSLNPTERARALDEARSLKQQLEAAHRLARDIDRQERRSDAVARARQVLNMQREVQAELDARRELRELDSLSDFGARRSIYGSF